MVLAQAEALKGQADIINAQTEQIKAQSQVENEYAKTQIAAFDSETKRQSVQIDAAKAGADINLRRIDQFQKGIEQRLSATQRLRTSVAQ